MKEGMNGKDASVVHRARLGRFYRRLPCRIAFEEISCVGSGVCNQAKYRYQKIVSTHMIFLS